MSWSNIFYPGNPERKERLIRKSQELLELMKNNFRATNQLIEALKKHSGLSFRPIEVNNSATVGENCDIIIERIREIQAEVEKIDKELKESLEPTLYEKLKNMSFSVDDYQKHSRAISVTLGVTGTAGVIAAGWLIKNGTILTSMRTAFGVIKTTALASVAIGVLVMGVDMIISAILGGIERSKLESALEEYDRALAEFRPASYDYQDNITYVKIRLQRGR